MVPSLVNFYRQLYGFFSFIQSDTLCLLTGMFILVTFNVITDVVRFEFIFLLLVLY